ncbi:hypothetical protein ACHAXR_012150 [Thalassiosira sp. AJA248-18]
MGNTLPITSPPKPSSTRHVIFMEPQCVRSYLREPWRRPVGELRMLESTNDLPPALDGVVPLDDYRDMMSSVADHVANFRGGRVHIGVGLFQACMLLGIVLGFFLSRYILGKNFFNPITLGVLLVLEFGVLSQAGRLFQREENALTKALLELLHPWQQQYGIIAKMRKTGGPIGEGKKSAIYYCLVLEKMQPDNDTDTVSLSTCTDMESDIESEV